MPLLAFCHIRRLVSLVCRGNLAAISSGFLHVTLGIDGGFGGVPPGSRLLPEDQPGDVIDVKNGYADPRAGVRTFIPSFPVSYPGLRGLFSACVGVHGSIVSI